MTQPTIILKKDREKSVLKHHPWIFTGAIQEIEGSPSAGVTIRILNSKKEFLAWGAFSPKSQILARIWSWNEEEKIDSEFIHSRIRAAIDLRNTLFNSKTTDAARLIFSESDGIPGFILDQYNDFLIVQISSSAAEYWKDDLVKSCAEITGISNIFERSDSDIRKLEGYSQINGRLLGETPPDKVQIYENGIKYFVDIKTGQKTGFFLDQRTNRFKIRDYSSGKKVLNCFSYTGGFTLNALIAQSGEVVSIDSSEQAITLGKKNIVLNDIDNKRASWIQGDVFKELRVFRDRGEKFDLIILDPPKFAPTIHSLEKANRAYKDINLLAFKLLNPGGILTTFSCSGGVTPDLFQKIVFGASLDAGVEAVILEKLHQDRDHPIPLNFPEAEYLKGLICRIT